MDNQSVMESSMMSVSEMSQSVVGTATGEDQESQKKKVALLVLGILLLLFGSAAVVYMVVGGSGADTSNGESSGNGGGDDSSYIDVPTNGGGSPPGGSPGGGPPGGSPGGGPPGGSPGGGPPGGSPGGGPPGGSPGGGPPGGSPGGGPPGGSPGGGPPGGSPGGGPPGGSPGPSSGSKSITGIPPPAGAPTTEHGPRVPGWAPGFGPFVPPSDPDKLPSPVPGLKVEKRAMINRPLLCTMGKYATHWTMYPDDGLCDIMYYTHIVAVTGLFAGTRNMHTFQLYLFAAAHATRTRYGVSFDSATLKTTLHEIQKYKIGNNPKIFQLWQLHIRNYAILNFNGNRNARQLLEVDALSLFQIIKNTVKYYNKERDSNPNYVGLGLRLYDYSSKDERRSLAEDIRKYANWDINILVVNTAVHEWGVKEPCRNLPPSMLDAKYNPLQPTIGRAIDIVNAADPNDDLVVALAFTMGVTFFDMYKNFSKVHEFNHPCKTYTIVSYRQVCEPKTKKMFDQAAVMKPEEAYLIGVKGDYAFSWDSRSTLSTKMRAAKGRITHQNIGFMLFDVEFEEHTPVCQENTFGTFPRIRLAREFMDTLN